MNDMKAKNLAGKSYPRYGLQLLRLMKQGTQEKKESKYTVEEKVRRYLEMTKGW